MIRYALVCDQGHDFESWFSTSGDYDAQTARGLVECPFCGTKTIRKQIMAPRIGRSDPAETTTLSSGPVSEPAPVALIDEKQSELRAMIKALRDHITAHAENVGTGFAEEARKIHYGEAEKRTIIGQTTSEEARSLVEEGVEFHALPTLPDERN